MNGFVLQKKKRKLNIMRENKYWWVQFLFFYLDLFHFLGMCVLLYYNFLRGYFFKEKKNEVFENILTAFVDKNRIIDNDVPAKKFIKL